MSTQERSTPFSSFRPPTTELRERAVSMGRFVRVLALGVACEGLFFAAVVFKLDFGWLNHVIGFALSGCLCVCLVLAGWFAASMQESGWSRRTLAAVAGACALLPVVPFGIVGCVTGLVRIMGLVVVAATTLNLQHAAEMQGFRVWFTGRLSPIVPRTNAQGERMCVDCGYSLKGLAADAACPECGRQDAAD